MSSTDLKLQYKSLVYLEDVRYSVVEMFPLFCVEVLQLCSVLVLTLISHVSPQVVLGFGLNIYGTNINISR